MIDLSGVADFEINGKIDKIEVDGDIIRIGWVILS